jgi:chromosome segregation ATPase
MISDFDDVAKKLTETADDVQSIVQKLDDLATAEAALQSSSHSLSDAGSALTKLTGDVGATTAELGRAIAGLREAVDAIKATDPAVVRDTMRDVQSRLGKVEEAIVETNKSVAVASSETRGSIQDEARDVKSHVASSTAELDARAQQFQADIESLRQVGRYGLILALGILAASVLSVALLFFWHAR